MVLNPDYEMNKKLFREEALSNLASPEQTDQMMTQPSVMLWLSLIGLILLVTGVCFWVITGTVYTVVYGKGIIIENSSEAEVIFFVPIENGKEIEPGMQAQISPSNLDKEEFAYLHGLVIKVSSWPVSREYIEETFNNSDLDDYFIETTGIAPYEVHISVLHDKNNPSEYYWSKSVQKPVNLSTGITCSGGIKVREDHPLGLILPWFRNNL